MSVVKFFVFLDLWVVYSVQKGDNLWTISKRITGKGINYHWIADDNNIFNPDLIYPNRK
jgi:nucleoid-associated protein YgaU